MHTKSFTGVKQLNKVHVTAFQTQQQNFLGHLILPEHSTLCSLPVTTLPHGNTQWGQPRTNYICYNFLIFREAELTAKVSNKVHVTAFQTQQQNFLGHLILPEHSTLCSLPVTTLPHGNTQWGQPRTNYICYNFLIFREAELTATLAIFAYCNFQPL